MKTYEPPTGEHIDAAAEAMVKLANFSGEAVTATFNDIPLHTAPGGDARALARSYQEEMRLRHEAYLASPEHAQRQQEANEAQGRKERLLREALEIAPEKPTLRNEAAWAQFVNVNTDYYGAACVRYADNWARVMEARMVNGITVEECAKAASHIADNEGITGFMYGCAVSMLALCWTHGEALRRWHNLDTQIGNEGEKANESGGTLNPALLTVGGAKA